MVYKRERQAPKGYTHRTTKIQTIFIQSKEMRKILIMAITLLLLGCKQEPTSGYVVRKEHTPGTTVFIYDCVLKMLMPYVLPERYEIYVGDSIANKRVGVKRKEYDSIKAGTYIIIDSEGNIESVEK
jgi:hypothetical protein